MAMVQSRWSRPAWMSFSRRACFMLALAITTWAVLLDVLT